MVWKFSDAFKTIPQHIAKSYVGINGLLHILAVVLTYMLVVTGFDWFYFISVHGNILQGILFPSAVIGALVPFIVPLFLFFYGKAKKRNDLVQVGVALGQAVIISLLVTSAYKALTGRVHPEVFNVDVSVISDISRQFHFGFFREGIFWGWPSSHTANAFSMATVYAILYPQRKFSRILFVLYAFYIGIGVSATIHWFSEFVAGALVGTAVGRAVGSYVRNKK